MSKSKKKHADYYTTVRYGETDKMKVAYYANYPVWFEAGRGAYGRKFGLSYREFEDLGFYAVVAELNCRYIRSIQYLDKLVIRTSIVKITSRTVEFEYQIFKEKENILCATGSTKHVCLSKDGRVAKLPENWLNHNICDQ